MLYGLNSLCRIYSLCRVLNLHSLCRFYGLLRFYSVYKICNLYSLESFYRFCCLYSLNKLCSVYIPLQPLRNPTVYGCFLHPRFDHPMFTPPGLSTILVHPLCAESTVTE